MADPAKLVQAQMSLWQDYMALWQHTGRRMMGEESEPLVEPARDDRRFRHAEWDDNHLFDFIKQSYLLTARWIQATVHPGTHYPQCRYPNYQAQGHKCDEQVEK